MDDLDNSQDPDNNFLEAYSNPDLIRTVGLVPQSLVLCVSVDMKCSQRSGVQQPPVTDTDTFDAHHAAYILQVLFTSRSIGYSSRLIFTKYIITDIVTTSTFDICH